MKDIEGFVIGAFGLWQMGAGVAVVAGLVVGGQDAVQRTPMKDIPLFDTPAKVIWFVYGAAHVLAYAILGGFSAPKPANAPAPPEEPTAAAEKLHRKRKRKGKSGAASDMD